MLPPAVFQRGRRLGTPVRSSAGPRALTTSLSKLFVRRRRNAARKQAMAICASARQCESCLSTSAAMHSQGGNKLLSFELEPLFPHCEARLASWLGPRGLSGYVGSRHRSAQPHAQGIVGLSRGIARMQRKVGNQRRDKSVVLRVWRRPYAAHFSQCRQQQATREVSSSAAVVG